MLYLLPPACNEDHRVVEERSYPQRCRVSDVVHGWALQDQVMQAQPVCYGQVSILHLLLCQACHLEAYSIIAKSLSPKSSHGCTHG